MRVLHAIARGACKGWARSLSMELLPDHFNVIGQGAECVGGYIIETREADMNKQVLHRVAEMATAQWLAQGQVITKCRPSLAPVCQPALRAIPDTVMQALLASRPMWCKIPRCTLDLAQNPLVTPR